MCVPKLSISSRAVFGVRFSDQGSHPKNSGCSGIVCVFFFSQRLAVAKKHMGEMTYIIVTL